MGKSARYDSNRVKLRTGEYQKSDGRYEFHYTVFGKKYSVYAKSLDELRDKEAEIYSVKTANQTRFDSRTTTLNDVFGLWKELKRGLRPNTFQNYCYMYQQYVQENLGRQYIASIKKSDVKRFFNHLADERRLQEQVGVTCDISIDGYTDFVFLNRFGGLHTQGTLNKVYKRIMTVKSHRVFSYPY